MGVGTDGVKFPLFQGDILPEDAWYDATIILFDEITALDLVAEGLDGKPTVAWSQPLVTCPNKRANAGFKNVIFVSLDTLRADRVGVYDTRHSLTPNIDGVAREGMLFENAYAQFPNTLASHATMFAGYYPSQHGLVAGSDRKIGEDTETLAAAFAERGYRTVAFTENAYVSATFGFDNGFDRYHNGPAVTEDDLFPGSSRLTFARALRWLRTVDDSVFFLFIHTYEVHTPYRPSIARLSKVMALYGQRYEGAYRFEYQPLTELAFNRGRVHLSVADIRQIETLYDAEVSSLDDHVGILIRTIDELGLTDSTLLVLTSDHGDEFSEHGYMGHGETLHGHALHVPLILRLPSVVPPGRRVKSVVGLIDVGPTIAELAGIGSIMTNAPAESLASLVTGRRNGAERAERPVFSELNASLGACGEWREGAFEVCSYDGVAVRDGSFSYFESASLGERKLFDVRKDPGEQHDLAAAKPEVAERYSGMVRRFRDSVRQGMAANPVPAEMDKSTEEKLRALGYIQ